MEVCAGFELIAIEDATALGHDVLELSKRREAQMIRHKRHGSPPRLLALQSILSPNRRESLPTPSAGDRMTGQQRLSWYGPVAATMAGKSSSKLTSAREQARRAEWCWRLRSSRSRPA